LVYVVDDHPSAREGVAGLIRRQPDDEGVWVERGISASTCRQVARIGVNEHPFGAGSSGSPASSYN